MLGLTISDVDVATIAASDPLFGPNIQPGAATVRPSIFRWQRAQTSAGCQLMRRTIHTKTGR